MINLSEFQTLFPDDAGCLEYIRNRKYPKRITCQQCSNQALYHKVKARKTYACDYCGHQISPTAGTPFHKSRTPLTTWFYVIFRLAESNGKVSAKQIQRETGVTYKTAWRMCKSIREIIPFESPS